jgi:hypothetical protein
MDKSEIAWAEKLRVAYYTETENPQKYLVLYKNPGPKHIQECTVTRGCGIVKPSWFVLYYISLILIGL